MPLGNRADFRVWPEALRALCLEHIPRWVLHGRMLGRELARLATVLWTELVNSLQDLSKGLTRQWQEANNAKIR